MDVMKYRHKEEEFFVQYEENEDVKSIKTIDEPETGLLKAEKAVAAALLNLFEMGGRADNLFSIDWKDGEKGGSKCVLLAAETSPYGKTKTAFPKVTSQEAETPEEGIYDPGNLKNAYNAAVDTLREEVKRFVLGARKQRPLPLEDETGPKKGRKKTVMGQIKGLFGGNGKEE